MRDSPGRQRLDLRRGASGDVASSPCASTSATPWIVAIEAIRVAPGDFLLAAEQVTVGLEFTAGKRRTASSPSPCASPPAPCWPGSGPSTARPRAGSSTPVYAPASGSPDRAKPTSQRLVMLPGRTTPASATASATVRPGGLSPVSVHSTRSVWGSPWLYGGAGATRPDAMQGGGRARKRPNETRLSSDRCRHEGRASDGAARGSRELLCGALDDSRRVLGEVAVPHPGWSHAHVGDAGPRRDALGRPGTRGSSTPVCGRVPDRWGRPRRPQSVP